VSGKGVLLDSVIVIDHLNGVDLATEYLRQVGPNAHVSAITRAEVLAGVPAAKAARVRALLDALPLVVIDAPVADLAAELRRSFRWRLPDAIQAAVAIHHGLRLATRNTKDFPPRRHDFVVVPYELRRQNVSTDTARRSAARWHRPRIPWSPPRRGGFAP
jgi:predicted nucleic acid-binding protein